MLGSWNISTWKCIISMHKQVNLAKESQKFSLLYIFLCSTVCMGSQTKSCCTTTNCCSTVNKVNKLCQQLFRKSQEILLMASTRPWWPSEWKSTNSTTSSTQMVGSYFCYFLFCFVLLFLNYGCIYKSKSNYSSCGINLSLTKLNKYVGFRFFRNN